MCPDENVMNTPKTFEKIFVNNLVVNMNATMGSMSRLFECCVVNVCSVEL